MNPLTRIPVDSSMLSAVGYDEEEKILYAEFSNTGKIYAYPEVPKEEFEALLKADSIGRFMRNEIIPAFTGFVIQRGKDIRW